MVDLLRAMEISYTLDTVRYPRGKNLDIWIDEVEDILRLTLPSESKLLLRLSDIRDEVNKEGPQVSFSEDSPWLIKITSQVSDLIDIAQMRLKLNTDQVSGQQLDRIVRSTFHEQFIDSWPLRAMFLITIIAAVVTFGGSLLTSIDVKNGREEITQQLERFDNTIKTQEKEFADLLEESLRSATNEANLATLRIQEILRAVREKVGDQDHSFAQEIHAARANLQSIQAELEGLESLVVSSKGEIQEKLEIANKEVVSFATLANQRLEELQFEMSEVDEKSTSNATKLSKILPPKVTQFLESEVKWKDMLLTIAALTFIGFSILLLWHTFRKILRTLSTSSS